MKPCRTIRFFGLLSGIVLLTLSVLPPVFADNGRVLERIEALEKEGEWNREDIDSLVDRLDKAELHTATDTLSFDLEFRTRADSIHYDDIRMAPPSLADAFFTPIGQGGFDGATLAQIQQAIAGMGAAGMVPPPEKVDADNDVIYTNRFRLNMLSRFNRHLDFRGRLAAYKVFGDSTEVKVNRGVINDVYLDGNTASLPHGDTVHLERAYFVYKNEIGIVPVSFSAGRRPSTEGPPLEYRNFDLVGGSPLATIINWQFDGASLSFGLEEVTGIPGAHLKICYGLGYETDWGNAATLNPRADVDDVHMLGFISDLYDDGDTSLILNYAHAWDITDGFTGLTVFPFVVAKEDRDTDGVPEYFFSRNDGAFISRLEPSVNIGDWDAASLLLRAKVPTSGRAIDWFVSGSLSHTDPSGISENPFYEIMGTGLLSSGGDLEARDGYSVYGGIIFPVPFNARLGLEYNWGSRYWFNFTGAEDSLIGSKLAVRGQVFESYWIQPLYGRNFFTILGGQFYDYAYTGSGNPLGKPVEISDIGALDAINAVTDQVWNIYLSVTVRF